MVFWRAAIGICGKRLMAFLFAEVQLPKAPAGKTPRLKSRIPSDRYVFTWDARRRAGYVLALPRDGAHEVRFRVTWEYPGVRSQGSGVRAQESGTPAFADP